ncbi:unnamed protein product [Trifolium pratense]|uniref:Uncharacterized protein n=1 Tax=Trifolium pratense TaxID=57577 RepID=A0ACB0I926_TRIPR|nr:unnamed protein product [Trifolium pratense]
MSSSPPPLVNNPPSTTISQEQQTQSSSPHPSSSSSSSPTTISQEQQTGAPSSSTTTNITTLTSQEQQQDPQQSSQPRTSTEEIHSSPQHTQTGLSSTTLIPRQTSHSHSPSSEQILAMNNGMSNYVFVAYHNIPACLVIAPFAVYRERDRWSQMTWSVFRKILALSVLGPIMDQDLYFLGMK